MLWGPNMNLSSLPWAPNLQLISLPYWHGLQLKPILTDLWPEHWTISWKIPRWHCHLHQSRHVAHSPSLHWHHVLLFFSPNTSFLSYLKNVSTRFLLPRIWQIYKLYPCSLLIYFQTQELMLAWFGRWQSGAWSTCITTEWGPRQ